VLTRRLVIAGLLAMALDVTVPREGLAQVYAWRDDAGALVVSRQPRATGAETFAVRGTGGVRAGSPAPAGSDRFDAIIESESAAQGVSPALVRAVIQVESGFNPRAVSPKGALGLMQLMPSTAAELGVGNPFDPAQNVRGGVAYLGQLLTRYAGDETLALAAYNAGPAAVRRYGDRVPPYRETRSYVGKVTSLRGLASGPPRTIFKTTETINGREVPLYTNVRPATGTYAVVPVR
jgi:soluble lytic murein transglycosylase-like protein